MDTLTLRREENEEIMKGVLRWLLGPTFDFMPADVVNLFQSQPGVDLPHGSAGLEQGHPFMLVCLPGQVHRPGME